MYPRLTATLLAVVLAMPGLVHGQTPGGAMSGALTPPPRFLASDLLGLCDGPEGSGRLNGCLRYLQGAVAMYELLFTEGKEVAWFCAPREAPAGLLRQQYVEWARDNTDQMGVDAIQAVRVALTDAFPCQE